MAQSNSIIIFIPILNFPNNLSILKNPNFISPKLNLDKDKNFGKFEKLTLISKPVEVDNRIIKEYIGIEFPNKINIKLELYHIQNKSLNSSENANLYFFLLDIY